ncbi:MAG: hypothetical protein IJL73_06945 [Lachnospiraceae bacterium]|nr:hypothetical protein [Lachnospiraceae bacterium]
MKRLRIMFLLIAALAMLGNGGIHAENNTGSDKEFLSFVSEEERGIIEEIGIERFAKEILSNETYKHLTATFSFDPKTAQYSTPEYYGGAFIDPDGGLVVNIKEGYEDCLEDLRTRTGGGEYKVKYVKHNLQELYEIIWELKDHLAEAGGDLNDNFVGFGLNEEEAKVYLYVLDDDIDKIKDVYQYVNDPDVFTVMVESGDGKIVDTVNVLAGNPIQNASVAYRAYELNDSGTSVYGVLTAGHVVNSGSYISSTDGVAFAKCISRQYGGTADAAFCKITNSSYTLTNGIYTQSGYTLGLGETNPACGTTVYKVGKTTNVTSGQVTDTYYNGTANGVSFYGLTKAEYSCDFGDSGGLVYQISNTGRDTVGIHKGYVGSNSVSIFSKAMVVDALFDCYRY